MAKLDKLKQQLDKIKQEIAEEEKRIKQQQAKQRKRKIEIIGAFYLDDAAKNGSLTKLAKTLDKAGRLTKKADRALFGLSDNDQQKIAGKTDSPNSQSQTAAANE